MSLENCAKNSWLERRDSDAAEIARLLSLSSQVKTGHTWSPQNRPWEGSRDLDVVGCRSLFIGTAPIS